jgi:hypothetical protein
MANISTSSDNFFKKKINVIGKKLRDKKISSEPGLTQLTRHPRHEIMI